jgi:hypothetical protein
MTPPPKAGRCPCYESQRQQYGLEMKAKVLTPPRPMKSNELMAVGYIRDAGGYADAAEQLVNFRNHNPRYFLFCHAIELALKSYILAAGGDQKELKTIRHDLQKAYDRARALGYKPTDPSVPDIVETLDPYHKDYTFRYKDKTGLQILPNADELADAVKSMLNQIEPITRAAYLKTQKK